MLKSKRFGALVVVTLWLFHVAAPFTLAEPPQQFESVIIQTGKPYTKLVAEIQALGGTVKHQYKYIDGIAADIPSDAMDSLRALAGSSIITKDLIIPAPIVETLRRNDSQTASVTNVRAGSATAISDFSTVPAAAYSLNNLGLNIQDLHKRGKTGAGVVVAIVDSGVRPRYPLLDIDNAVIGGADFVGDGLGFSNSKNEPHGTYLAGLITGNASFSLGSNSSLASSINSHFPGALVGFDLPVVGTAPGASIYAVRVFGTATLGAPKSRIIAAIMHVIEMRKNGLNIQVCNLSLGSTTLYAGRDVFDMAVDSLLANGIVPVVSAGDVGPSGLTVASPATSLSSIAVGSASAAANERVEQDLLNFLGYGRLYRPSNDTEVAWFSSRGPNADGRPSPDVIAVGSSNFGQGYGSATQLSIASGTSFSAPLVSGVAAVLRQAFPNATAAQIRNAIISSGNPSLAGAGFTRLDQGTGFPDALGAESLLNGNISGSLPVVNPTVSVATNVKQGAGLDVSSDSLVFSTGNLAPARRAEILYNIQQDTSRVVISLSNFKATLNNPSSQNVFPEQIYFQVHSAKTSQIGMLGDYFDLGNPFTTGGTYTINDPEPGLMRITLSGSFTNQESVSATVTVSSDTESLPKNTTQGTIFHHAKFVFPVTIPKGVAQADFRLFFHDDWGHYPTSDVDMILIDPNLTRNTDGAHLNDPETATVFNPVPGTWQVQIIGFDVPAGSDQFELRVSLDGKVVK
jgi:subtilisin family serine protease